MLVIGEKINATRPQVKTVITTRDEKGLLELARRQAEAGADYIDVNTATGKGSQDEIAAMIWAVQTIQTHLETPLAIDSADPEVLAAGLEARGDRHTLINSTKAAEKSLNSIAPLAKSEHTGLVGLAMDEKSIPESTAGRLKACEIIADACVRHGVGLERLWFDALVMPISTDAGQGLVTLETLAQIKKRYPQSKTLLGLSNISFGLPERSTLNQALLHMGIFVGLDAIIADPLDGQLKRAILAGEALVGRDRFCRRYTRAFRKR